MCGASNKMIARVVQHRTPTGQRRQHSQSEETQSGFCKDCSRHSDRCLDQHRLKNIWQQMIDE